MGCSTCGGRKSSQQEGPFVVTNNKTGETVEVKDEFAARVQIAKWGSGSYAKKA